MPGLSVVSTKEAEMNSAKSLPPTSNGADGDAEVF